MQDKNQQNSQNTNWKKKGLGWVPDYPDLRDYNLDNEDIKNRQRLKVEETTEWLENIIDELINLQPKKNLSTTKINELRNKIFGEVIFKRIKVHKILKYTKGTKENQKYGRYTLNEIKYDSILSKQIIQLKKYLGILLLQYFPRSLSEKIGLPSHYSVPQDDNSNYFYINNTVDFIQWMEDESYDFHTKKIVELFQCLKEIRKDGIVGLETYTVLNEYLSEPKKITEYEIKQCQSQLEDNSKQQPLSKIKYLALTSTIPNKGFEEIIKILYLRTEHLIIGLTVENEFLNYINVENEFFTCINVKPNIFEEALDKIFKNSHQKENVQSISNKSFKDIYQTLQELYKTPANQKSQYEFNINNIVNFLKNSRLIEPIISVLIRIISPLSQYKNNTLEELIEQGFKNFENLLKQEKEEQENVSIEPQGKELGHSHKELAQYAVHKVISFLSDEIQLLAKELDEKKDKDKVSREFIISIFSCLLINNYLNQFIYTKIAKSRIANEKKDSLYNPFDKHEVFEIEIDDDEIEHESRLKHEKSSSKSNNKQSKLEFFSSLNLYIPIFANAIIRDLDNYKNNKTNKNKKPFFQLPTVVDLSYWFSPVKDQGSLNSCTAFAAISLLEYFANKNSKDKIEPSTMFLYKAARNKMNVTGDAGASIRETMKALALFGVPPEQYWSYDEEKVDEEPPAYCYAFAQNYKTLKYFLLDYAGISKETLLFQIKAVLAAGLPCIFGLTLYTSAYNTSNEKGHIPFPDYKEDKIAGGHTLVAVGYDDLKCIKCANKQNYSKGAFLVRNSWGTEWGVDGYGWLPYDYVLAGLTAAWWSLIKSEWFNESSFGLAGTGGGGNDPRQPP